MKVFKVDADSSDNTEIRAKKNQTVAIEVAGGGTTGYLWEIASPPSGLKVHEHTVQPDLESFGGSGTDRFVVSADQPGSLDIKLELKRPWEDSPAKSVKVKLAAD